MIQAYADLASLDALHHEYLDHFQRLSGSATFWKRCHRWTWFLKTALTWLSVLLAIIGLAWSGWPELGTFFLTGVIPVFSMVGLALAGFELLVGPQNRWQTNRVTAQQLGELAMLFRARLPPFHDDHDGTLLRQHLNQLRTASGEPKRTWGAVVRQAIDEYRLPAVPAGNYQELPQQGLVPPLGSDAARYLNGRLRGQRQWYLQRAHQCRRHYFTIMALTGLVNAGNVVIANVYGGALWLVGLSTALNLMLFALLDFLNSRPLWRQYRQTAAELEQIERAFADRQRPYGGADENRRVQLLVEQVEAVLATEFQHWYTIHKLQPPDPGKVVPDKPAYRPRPIDTSGVELPEELNQLQEVLARNIHDRWAIQRIEEGWQYGLRRDDAGKETPCLVPYETLPEPEKEYDRVTAMETLKAIFALGYRVQK